MYGFTQQSESRIWFFSRLTTLNWSSMILNHMQGIVPMKTFLMILMPKIYHWRDNHTDANTLFSLSSLICCLQLCLIFSMQERINRSWE